MVLLKIVFWVIAVLLVLFMLAVMPRMGHRKARRDFLNKIYYAHRGLFDNEGDAPENSMEAFRRAADAGYGMEMDVQITKDGVPVVFHDFTLKRMCGKEGKVCDYTWQELKEMKLGKSRETIPLFADVLKTVGGRVPLIVEIKVEWMDLRICPAADGLLRGYQGLYCIESFNPLVLLWYRKNHKEVVRGQLSDGFVKESSFRESWHLMIQNFLLQNLLFNWLTKPDFVAYNHKYARIPARRICRSLYKNMAAAWTIKSQEELEKARGQFDLFIFDSFVPQ